MRHVLLLSGILLLSLLGLTAQTSTPTARAAQQPHILFDTVGPDGWRIRLGPTNLGSLLESEKGRALWQPHVEGILGIWQQLAGDEAAYAASRTRLLGYGGRIQIAMWVDPAADRGANEPAACIAAVLDGDGRSDLGAIAEDLRQTLYQAISGEWADIEVDGAKVAVRRNDELTVTAPMLEGGRVLIAVTSERDIALALQRARALAAAAAASAEIKPNSPAMRVGIDFAAIIAAIMANEPASDLAVMTALGIDHLGTGTVTVGTAGPRVQIEYGQEFDADDRGIFSALMPATASVPTLLLNAPKQGTWSIGHFDCLKLYETILDAVIASKVAGDGDLRAEIEEECGIDPAADLLAHMTDEVMLWLPEADDFDEDFDRTPWTITWRLRDDAKFRDGLLAMLPKAKPFLQREAQEAHGDVDVFRYGNMFGYDLWLAVGRGVFVFAGGRYAEDRLVSVLDGCKELPAELPAEGQLPDGFQALQRYLPPGCHGYSVGSASHVVSLPSYLWLGVISWFTPLPSSGVEVDPDQAAEEREELMALLKEHRLDVARSATGYAERTWRWRMYW